MPQVVQMLDMVWQRYFKTASQYHGSSIYDLAPLKYLSVGVGDLCGSAHIQIWELLYSWEGMMVLYEWRIATNCPSRWSTHCHGYTNEVIRLLHHHDTTIHGLTHPIDVDQPKSKSESCMADRVWWCCMSEGVSFTVSPGGQHIAMVMLRKW